MAQKKVTFAKITTIEGKRSRGALPQGAYAAQRAKLISKNSKVGKTRQG